MNLNKLNLLLSSIFVPILLLYLLFKTAFKGAISGDFGTASNRSGMFASYITWGLAKINYGFIFVLIIVLTIGFLTERVDRSGCLLVFLGVFFAFGNHFSPKLRIAINKSTNTTPKDYSSKYISFDIDEHFNKLAKPEYQEKSVFFEFIFVLFGTIFWGFG